MRSFKKKVLSAWTWAWALPALSAALPSGRDARVSQTHGKQSVLQLDLQPDYAQATFSVPCAGCLGQEDDDESLILSFRTISSDVPCGDAALSLNSLYLPQEWNGDLASGSGSFAGVPDVQKDALHDFDLEWESACLHSDNSSAINETDVAQVFTVTLKGIDGKTLDEPAGFTVSFKQLSPPELLRLEVTPQRGIGRQGSAHAEDWRVPPAHLRLPLPSSKDIESQKSLEDELRELRLLEAEVELLHKVIDEKKQLIQTHLYQESSSFKEQLHQCADIACVFKTVAQKAHGAWEVVYLRFRHKSNQSETDMVDAYERKWHSANSKQKPEAIVQVNAHAPKPTRALQSVPQATPEAVPEELSEETPIAPYDKEYHYGSYGDIELPPRPQTHQNQKPLFIALNIVVGLLCCGCLVTVIRQRCASIRTRTERAATREERRNARAYNRAARKLAWTRWWRGSRWRDQERRADYEEKRSLIQEQEAILEDAMQEEIRQFRAAHSVVHSLIQAEEGRSRPLPRPIHCPHYTNMSPPSPAPYSPVSTNSIYTNSSLAELPSRPLSRTNSLPDYRSDASTAPPAYESDEEVDIGVANGFRPFAHSSTPHEGIEVRVANGFRPYAPSTASDTASVTGSSTVSSRWTTESSVVDVSPRPSAETLRFAELGDTGVGEDKH